MARQLPISIVLGTRASRLPAKDCRHASQPTTCNKDQIWLGIVPFPRLGIVSFHLRSAPHAGMSIDIMIGRGRIVPQSPLGQPKLCRIPLLLAGCPLMHCSTCLPFSNCPRSMRLLGESGRNSPPRSRMVPGTDANPRESLQPQGLML